MLKTCQAVVKLNNACTVAALSHAEAHYCGGKHVGSHLKVGGLRPTQLCHCIFYELFSTLSLFTQVYKINGD